MLTVHLEPGLAAQAETALGLCICGLILFYAQYIIHTHPICTK
jgi:hypothetical protein